MKNKEIKTGIVKHDNEQWFFKKSPPKTTEKHKFYPNQLEYKKLAFQIKRTYGRKPLTGKNLTHLNRKKPKINLLMML